MTTGIESSTKKCHRLYRETLKQNNTEEQNQKYKEYRNTLNRVRRCAKMTYYNKKSIEYQHNTKKLWQLINSQLGKCKHRGSIISYVSVIGIKQYEPKVIANQFGKFYSELGMKMASTIKYDGPLVEDYVSNIPRNINSLFIHQMDQHEIERMIRSLPNKTSSGHDGVSNLLLKTLNESISYPLSIIFIQSLIQRIFPELMKRAEIIPLYKGQEQDLVVNY